MTNQELYKMLTGQGDEEKNLGIPSSESQATPELSAEPPGLDAFARTIVKRISDAAIELAFIRHSLTSDEVDCDDDADVQTRVKAEEAFCEEIKEDTFACLTGDETGCAEQEDLNETNCELIWLKAQLTSTSASDGTT